MSSEHAVSTSNSIRMESASEVGSRPSVEKEGGSTGNPDATRLVQPEPPSDASSALAAWVGDENPSALPLGTQLHEYSIQAVLGSGSFGITYLAHDANLHCMVAIKEYFPESLAVRRRSSEVAPAFENDREDYAQGLTRFLNETRVLAGFRHHNIVRVTRFFEANATAYMVMDYEEGQPLRDWLKRHGSLGEPELLRMFMPLLDGLEVVHRGGVLHRDIKPGNLYVRNEDSSLVLLDFGAARHVRIGQSKSLTRIVTPGYAPFEQYHSRGALGPWSDLYALGGVLYWIVTGEKPIESPSRTKFDDMPKAVALASGKYSGHLLEAIDWALLPEEKERPQNVAEFRRALGGEATLETPSQAMTSATATHAVERRRFVWGVALGMLVVVGAATALFLRGAGTSDNITATHPPAASVLSAQPAPVGETAPRDPSAVLTASEQASGERDGNLSLQKNPALPKSPAPSDATTKKAPSLKSADTARSTGKNETSSQQQAARPDAPVAQVFLAIYPVGKVFVDGKLIGTAPPLQQIQVSPGKHRIAVHGDLPPGVHYFDIDLAAGESKRLRAEFAEIKY